MRVSVVVTFTGPDRPGIVETLAKTVAEHEGNWEESRMAHLAGRFAGLLRVTVEQQRADELVQALSRLADLTVTVDHGTADQPQDGGLSLEVTGADHPGIVARLTGVLVEHGLNIGALETETRDAPMAGHTLFIARFTLQAQAGVDVDGLREALERIADDLVVDVTLQQDR